MNPDLEAALAKAGIRELYDDWTSPPDELLKRLLDNLRADKRTAEWTANLVHQLGPVTDDVIPAMIRALDFEERSARPLRRALVACGPPAMTQLVEELRTTNRDDSLRCTLLIQAIGEFSAAAAEATSDLTECLDHPLLHVRVHAAIALWRIDGRAQGRASVVAQGLSIPGLWEIVDPSVAALCEMGAEAQEVLPVLLGVLEMDDARTGSDRFYLGRRGAMFVLEKMGPAAAAATAVLKATQSDPDESIRVIATEVLESIQRQIQNSPGQSSIGKPGSADDSV
jgi:hypothetical protein